MKTRLNSGPRDTYIIQRGIVVLDQDDTNEKKREYSLVCAVGILCLCGDGDMSDVADTGQGLSSKSIGRHRGQVAKSPQLACCESLANDTHVLKLSRMHAHREQKRMGLAQTVTRSKMVASGTKKNEP